MLRVSHLADYAVSILVYMAGDPRALYSAQRIAQDLHLPPATVAKILKALSKASLVDSKLGAHGGYTLGRRARDVTLDMIVRGIDGPVR